MIIIMYKTVKLMELYYQQGLKSEQTAIDFIKLYNSGEIKQINNIIYSITN